MKIESGQNILDFELRVGNEVWTVTESGRVSHELHQVFGAAPYEKWVGFEVSGNAIVVSPYTVQTRLRITFSPPTKHSVQIVPMVTTAGRKFSEHYILGLSVLSLDKQYVTTFAASTP